MFRNTNTMARRTDRSATAAPPAPAITPAARDLAALLRDALAAMRAAGHPGDLTLTPDKAPTVRWREPRPSAHARMAAARVVEAAAAGIARLAPAGLFAPDRVEFVRLHVGRGRSATAWMHYASVDYDLPLGARAIEGFLSRFAALADAEPPLDHVRGGTTWTVVWSFPSEPEIQSSVPGLDPLGAARMALWAHALDRAVLGVERLLLRRVHHPFHAAAALSGAAIAAGLRNRNDPVDRLVHDAFGIDAADLRRPPLPLP